ncbi:TIGR01777 family oxidoreductase [Leptolyngbya sp. 7M]|uniref:TIGR01777 family oxidoreductase n=1 Tax=Leptolyngbya sp. 7M TaxID=2812896 RepID=UPI001B8D3399|nr:TIGR01777 family oxidoreductase [Leptolyngbya sp. 7M]QYO66250.1 TIGR01777 family oxidoreductase [Leptolyngbya sp. 7M]
MKILITGASGLIGKALQRSFTEKGYQMLLASRSEAKDDKHIQWNVETGFAEEDLGRLEALDAAIHLAGENIAGLRWTDEKKKAIRDSRVFGTRTMIEAFAKLEQRPKTFIAGSAIGFYGDRGDGELTEASPSGNTFLAETCKEWEAESRRAEDLGIRTVLLRTGIVLSKDGGALATMLTPFKLGLGGVIGSGKQWMSWVSLDDVVEIVNFVLEDEKVRGAVNVVSPNPATNEEFTKTLGEVLYRPTILPLPEFAVHMVFGEMGDALLLDSTRVRPKRLLDSGYKFKLPDLRSALEQAVK